MQRRELLQTVGLTSLGLPVYGQPGTELSLKVAAQRSGREVGFAVEPVSARTAPTASLLAQHAGVITAENAMKWRSIENVFGKPDYGRSDAVAAIASSLKAKLRGHTLAWHAMVPLRLLNASPDEFQKAQSAHATALTQRYAGRMHTWDVLNEVVNLDDKRSDGLRESILSKLWGSDRYPVLFELAREADPQAKLAYNDYGMEQDELWSERRRTATLRLLEQWVKRKTPLDVLGMQAHLNLARRFSSKKLLNFFDEVHAMGLTIQITELDVRDADAPGDIAERDAASSALYQDFVQTCVSHPAVEMIVMWNVTDAHSWINRDPNVKKQIGRAHV